MFSRRKDRYEMDTEGVYTPQYRKSPERSAQCYDALPAGGICNRCTQPRQQIPWPVRGKTLSEVCLSVFFFCNCITEVGAFLCLFFQMAPSGKATRKSRHNMCSKCEQPLPESYTRDTCETCLNQSDRGQTNAFLAWFKDEMCNTFKELKDSLGQRKRKRVPRDVSPAASNTSGESSASSSSPEVLFDDLDDDLYLLPRDKFPKLLSAVKDTIESSKDVSARPKKDQLYYFPQIPDMRLPSHPILNDWFKKDWANPDRRSDVGARFKTTYRLDSKCSSEWENPPKLDLAAARMVKKSLFPSDESSKLSDPLERKADGLAKKNYLAAASASKVAASSVPVARALRIWLSQLSLDIEEGVSRDSLLKGVDMMKSAAEFLCDAPVDILKFSSRSLALSNATRRALWIKQWTGDMPSKFSFINMPSHPSSMFGPHLKDILKSYNEEKDAAFPLEKKKSNKPFFGRSRYSPRRNYSFRGRRSYYKKRQDPATAKKQPFNKPKES